MDQFEVKSFNICWFDKIYCIGMLECYELWNTAAEVIKLCWIAAVNNLSNEVFIFISSIYRRAYFPWQC